MPSVLSVAGSDSSGGAGIQADIKAIAAHHLFAQTAVTAITAQNTLGVSAVQALSPELVEAQIDAVFQDIRPDAVKVGMIPTAEVAQAVARALERNGAKNVVVDPVMVATSGSSLTTDAAVLALREHLVPRALVLTPNLQEAQVLAGMDISSREEVEQAARIILELGPRAVLVKGGHFAADQPNADDYLLLASGQDLWIAGERISNPNTHGTGCTLSSAIACGLARGLDVEQAVRGAKEYLTNALRAQLDLGKGSGPLDHLYMLA
ncbi:MAG: bifunctional hydroxymethylpyrimidine kinase/phosphomethylpyrimidine kinase [Coriobacteriia bacterium]|nr:bifunctional hydroxymethylpyrimidine kinase/phosphomethylpyrimidine kinase [Coriobacteriia bacterium]